VYYVYTHNIYDYYIQSVSIYAEAHTAINLRQRCSPATHIYSNKCNHHDVNTTMNNPSDTDDSVCYRPKHSWTSRLPLVLSPGGQSKWIYGLVYLTFSSRRRDPNDLAGARTAWFHFSCPTYSMTLALFRVWTDPGGSSWTNHGHRHNYWPWIRFINRGRPDGLVTRSMPSHEMGGPGRGGMWCGCLWGVRNLAPYYPWRPWCAGCTCSTTMKFTGLEVTNRTVNLNHLVTLHTMIYVRDARPPGVGHPPHLSLCL